MSTESFSINDEEGSLEEGLAKLSQNQVIWDCDALEPFAERIKLEGDEYKTGNKRLDKNELSAGA